MKVEFSIHAQERAKHRLPQLGLRAIAHEVADAIAEGRVSKEAPNWMLSERFVEARRQEFAWTPDRRHVYVLGNRRRNRVTVVTCVVGMRAAA